MISIRQYRLLSELKENEQNSIISIDIVQQALKSKYGAKKYSDEIISCEISQLNYLGYVTSPDSPWFGLTPAGKLLVTEYWKRSIKEIGKYIFINIIIPIVLSIATTLITLFIKR